MKKTHIKILLLTLLFALIVMPLNIYASNDWPIQNGDPRLSNFNPTTLGNDIFLKHEILLANIGNPSLMLASGDTLYTLSSRDMKVFSVSLDTKAINWEFTPKNQQDIRNLALVNGNIAVETYNDLYLLRDDGSDKTLLWEQKAGGNTISYDENYIYTANQTTLYTVDIQNGEVKWNYTIPKGEVFHSPIINYGNKVYFVTNHPQQLVTKLFALDKSSGVVQWTTNVDYYSKYPLVQEGKIFLSSQKELFAYHATTGVYLWKKPLNAVYAGFYDNTFTANSSTLYTRTQDGDLLAFNITNGELIFKKPFGEYIAGRYVPFTRGIMLATNNEVILENNGKVKFYDTVTGDPTRIISIPNTKMEPLLVTDKYLLTFDSQKLYVYAPPSDEQYVEPDGDGKAELPPSPTPSDEEYIYVVKAGDVLWKIAYAHNTTVDWIIKRNQLDPSTYLWVGQNLILPKQVKIHTVVVGDTLWKIANQYGVTISSIVEKNGLDPTKYLFVGQKIMIPEAPKSHIVQAGDTLWKIAEQYNTTIQAIVEKNNLDPTKYLYVGQKIIIP